MTEAEIDNLCVAMKDRLYVMLNDAETCDQLMTLCEVELVSVFNKPEFWQAATYCYKASEICKQVKDRLADYVDGLHWRAKPRVESMRDKFRNFEDQYFRLQQEYLRRPVVVPQFVEA